MKTKDNTRKPYQRPQVTQVKLEMEEAVLQACKASSAGKAKGNRQCGHPGCKTTFGS